MSESAESMVANLSSSRNLTIEISNKTTNYCLIDPKVFLDSGHCHSPPQPTVRPLKNEICNFTKSKGKAEGAVGVLCYNVFKRGTSGPSDQIAIMFSVPYDYNLFQNWHAVGVYEVSRACDQDLFKEMYNNDQEGFKRQESDGNILLYRGSNLDVMATMSPLGRSIMKVEVWEKVFKSPTL